MTRGDERRSHSLSPIRVKGEEVMQRKERRWRGTDQDAGGDREEHRVNSRDENEPPERFE